MFTLQIASLRWQKSQTRENVTVNIYKKYVESQNPRDCCIPQNRVTVVSQKPRDS